MKTCLVVLVASLASVSAYMAPSMAPGPAPSAPSGPFTLAPLPYAYDALEPIIDMETMHLHHDKHQKAYVDNLNTAVASQNELASLSLVEIQKAVNTSKVPASIASTVRNNGGGDFNHAFFWKVMAPANSTNSTGPVGELASAINSTFGSTADFKKKFTAAATARFGSGFAWLILANNGSLVVLSTPNQDNPLQNLSTVEVNGFPILTLDVWEHAYYLKYQNRRPDYIKAWWNIVNWVQANQNYLDAKAGNVASV